MSRVPGRLRSRVGQLVLTAVLLGLVALVISGAVPGSSARLRRASVGWIVVAALAELGSCAAYAGLFWGVFSHREHRVGVARGAQIGLGELAGFVVTPTGAGGPALRVWALLRGGMPFRVVMTRSVIHAVVLQIPYVLVAVALGSAAVLGLGVGHARTVLALAPVGVVVVAVLVVVGAARLARRPERSRARWRRIGRDALEAIPAGVRHVPAAVRRRPLLVLAAAAYWAGDCGALVLAFSAARGSAPIGVIVLAYMLGQLGNALPLPGGVGGVEPAMLGVLTSSGVDAGLGGAAVVLYRFTSLGLQSVVGAIAVGRLIPAVRQSAKSD